MHHIRNKLPATIFYILTAQVLLFMPAAGQESFGPEELVQAGGVDITVAGYSVPSFVRWNGDDLPDLIVGEGGLGLYEGKVRVYLNAGSPGNPTFSDFFYAQSNGSDLASPSVG